MDTLYLFETYEKLPTKGKVVFLDVLSGIIDFIKAWGKFNGTITGRTVEGNDIIFFTYKNGLACWPEVREHFDISNSLELSSLTLIRIEVMEMLEKWWVVQKLHFEPKTQALLEEAFGMSEENLEWFYDKDNVTGRYIFNPQVIQRDGDNIVYRWASRPYSELDDETKQALKLYDKLLLSFWADDLTQVANLDESYFHYDLFLTSAYNLSSLRNMLKSDEGKDIIEKVWFENGNLIINGKTYLLGLRKNGEKAIEFLSLLSQYFSRYDTQQVTLTSLIDFMEREEISFKRLQASDVANSRQVNSYLETFHENIWKKYGWKPRIFQKKSTVITLEKAKKITNPSSL